MVNLWVSTSIFMLTICVMNMVGTTGLGIFFNVQYMLPIYEYSPHFRTLYKKYRAPWQTITAASYFGGVNIMRLMTSNLFGQISMTADLDKMKFYVNPLNHFSVATGAFSVSQGLLCMSALIIFPLSDDAWMLGLFGFILNGVLVLLTIMKHLQTRKWLASLQPGNNNNQRANQPMANGTRVGGNGGKTVIEQNGTNRGGVVEEEVKEAEPIVEYVDDSPEREDFEAEELPDAENRQD